MNIHDWALSIKPDMARLQSDKGIPALFAVAQFCHESSYDGGLSKLALLHHNYAGLKASEWQSVYGCTAVTMDTWEVIGGTEVDLSDAFCSCPDWPTWLRVYGDLLTGKFYGPALSVRNDPLLYAYQVWQRGWATDPAYMIGIARWMTILWEDYQETLNPVPAGFERMVPVELPDGTTVSGYIRTGSTYLIIDGQEVKLRSLIGGTAEWIPVENGGPRVIVRK